jgi:hypothetical protein
MVMVMGIRRKRNGIRGCLGEEIREKGEGKSKKSKVESRKSKK